MAIGMYPIPPPDEKTLDQILSDNSNKSVVEPNMMAIFEILEFIVNEPPPKLRHSIFSSEFEDFVDECLKKNPDERGDLKTLLVICCQCTKRYDRLTVSYCFPHF